MKRNGFLLCCLGIAALTLWTVPVIAAESADEITDMMTWWDQYGKDWDAAKDLIDFASETTESTTVLADNTVETDE